MQKLAKLDDLISKSIALNITINLSVENYRYNNKWVTDIQHNYFSKQLKKIEKLLDKSINYDENNHVKFLKVIYQDVIKTYKELTKFNYEDYSSLDYSKHNWDAEIVSPKVAPLTDALRVKKDKIDKGIYINKDGSAMTPIDGKVRLGNPNGFGEYQKLGVEKIKENARNNKNNIQAMDIICSARKEGMTFQAIADKLNKLQYTTRRGKQFNPIQVQRLFKKCED
jgi:hypothetical protein